MLEWLRRLFSNLFGGNDPEITDDIEEEVEDAADLGDFEVVQIIERDDEMDTATMRTRSTGTRGLEVDEVIEVSAADSTGGEKIAITSPKYLWCLDNGHGRLQNGKRSPFFEDGTQLEEWKFNRDIVRRIMDRLDELGIQYFNVVPEEEIGSFTSGRAQRANEKVSVLGIPKIYVSVHANAFGSSGQWENGKKGIEVWHYPNSKAGTRIASAFQEEIMKALPGWKDRGIKSHQQGSSKIFTVLRKASMPAVLTENGFYTDFDETTLLMKDEIRQKIAEAHVAAIHRIELNGYDNIPIYRPQTVIGG